MNQHLYDDYMLGAWERRLVPLSITYNSNAILTKRGYDIMAADSALRGHKVPDWESCFIVPNDPPIK